MKPVVPAMYSDTGFNVLKHVKLVPTFFLCEKDVQAYFRSFERGATSLSWSKKYWPILLQCFLHVKHTMCMWLYLMSSVLSMML